MQIVKQPEINIDCVLGRGVTTNRFLALWTRHFPHALCSKYFLWGDDFEIFLQRLIDITVIYYVVLTLTVVLCSLCVLVFNLTLHLKYIIFIIYLFYLLVFNLTLHLKYIYIIYLFILLISF